MDITSASGELLLPGSRCQIPKLGAPVLGRQRLISLIDQATRCQLTVLFAPSGAGKTVACASWARARFRTRQVAWVTLDADDGGQAAWFWASVYDALRRTSPEPSECFKDLDDESPADFPRRLAAATQLLSRPVVVVLDNAHLIRDDLVLEGVDILTRYASPGLRLLMSGHRPPCLRLDRIRASGELAELSGDHIAWGPTPGRG